MSKEQVQGFIITSHYETEDATTLHLYGRLETGKSFCVKIPRQPYFFIKTTDVDKAKNLMTINTKTVDLKTMHYEPVTQIVLSNPKEVPVLRKLFEDNNISCYEADIRFTQRYFLDNNILSIINIEGEATKGEFSDLEFIDPIITPANAPLKTQPTMLSIDIETDEKASTIYSISLYDKKHQEVIVVNNDAMENTNLNNATLVANEKDLLTTFMTRVREIDPDIIVGWNVIDFDFKVIARNCKLHNLNLALGRSNDAINFRFESSFFRDSHANVKGRVILDGIQLLKSSFVKLDDYKLNTAAKHFLKDEKLITEDNRFGIIDKMYTSDPQKFIDYNLKDSELVYDILIVSKIFELTVQRSLLAGLHMDNVKASIASFDSLYLRELRTKGFVAPSTRPSARDEGLGGYVMTSKPGIYSTILVLDFKSLYPSLMRTFNIDPLAYQGTVEELQKSSIDVSDKDRFIIAPNNAVFRNEEGIMPDMLTRLWDAREVARKEKNELARYAIKILMNSMYGVLASHNSRFHIRPLSNAITYFAQHFIKFTAKELEKKGFEVIYGDTDSVFVNVKTKDVKEAQEIGKKIETDLNVFFKEHITTEYHRDSILELEFEKLYVKFFMPKVRGSEEGAKKRYAGLKLQDDGSTKMDFTGLEFVRRDWTGLAKEFQLKLLDLIFTDKEDEVDNYIRTFVEDVKTGKHDDLLIYRKALRKDVDSYTKTTPPHVKAARLLKKIEGNIIEYYITTEGPQPLENVSAPLDYTHYIEKQVKPIADSVLGLQNKSFEDCLTGTKQTGLGKFF